MPSLIWRFSGSMASTCALHDFADLQHVARMVEPALGGDVGDVYHAFDAFGELHERAELLQVGDRPFDLRADGKLLCDPVPRIA